jgi:hypothetical protein
MSFQTKVNAFPAPGAAGNFASTNPYQSIDAGPGELVAGNLAIVGTFCWRQSDGTVESTGPVPLVAPTGFLANEKQGLITEWLGATSIQIPLGMPVTLYDRGDFWAFNRFAPAAINDKVFVNKYGAIAPGAAGAFLTTDVTGGAVITSAHIDDGVTAGTTGNVLTVVTVTGDDLVVGQLIEDANTGATVGYITALGTGTGGTGTYLLNQNAAYPAASAFSVGGYADTGWVGTASFATDVMTVVSTTSGNPSAGQFVSSAGVAAGTYIVTDNLDGTYVLSTSPGTITTQAAATSGWVETPFSIKSDANAGDIVKIGVRN